MHGPGAGGVANPFPRLRRRASVRIPEYWMIVASLVLALPGCTSTLKAPETQPTSSYGPRCDAPQGLFWTEPGMFGAVIANNGSLASAAPGPRTKIPSLEALNATFRGVSWYPGAGGYPQLSLDYPGYPGPLRVTASGSTRMDAARLATVLIRASTNATPGQTTAWVALLDGGDPGVPPGENGTWQAEAPDVGIRPALGTLFANATLKLASPNPGLLPGYGSIRNGTFELSADLPVVHLTTAGLDIDADSANRVVVVSSTAPHNETMARTLVAREFHREGLPYAALPTATWGARYFCI